MLCCQCFVGIRNNPVLHTDYTVSTATATASTTMFGCCFLGCLLAIAAENYHTWHRVYCLHCDTHQQRPTRSSLLPPKLLILTLSGCFQAAAAGRLHSRHCRHSWHPGAHLQQLECVLHDHTYCRHHCGWHLADRPGYPRLWLLARAQRWHQCIVSPGGHQPCYGFPVPDAGGHRGHTVSNSKQARLLFYFGPGMQRDAHSTHSYATAYKVAMCFTATAYGCQLIHKSCLLVMACFACSRPKLGTLPGWYLPLTQQVRC